MTDKNRRVAVVTGGNKGIGFEIVKRLCKEFDGDVILTGNFKTFPRPFIRTKNRNICLCFKQEMPRKVKPRLQI
jgi:short-subunit dehydrogenase involved in D-alanine esterification of teichoic acids